VFIYILNDVFIHSFQNCRNNPIDKFHIRAIPFKSTWEGGMPFFYYSVGCGGETVFVYVGCIKTSFNMYINTAKFEK
jgi:hypothetical protein